MINRASGINKEIKNIVPVILAGGLGTRMRASSPKALANLLENPMIFYSISALLNTKKYFNTHRGGNYRVFIDKIGIVVGHSGELVKNYILKEKRFKIKRMSFDFITQEKYLGTGDAALKAVDTLNSYDDNAELLFLPCDMPLIGEDVFEDMIKFHLDNKNDLTVLSFSADNPYSYGRILKDKKGYVKEIIEENELANFPESVKKTNEVNSGVYAVKLGCLKRLIKLIKPDNIKKEYYLTDIAKIFFKNGLRVMPFNSFKKDEFIGVNSKPDLLNAQSLMQKRVISKVNRQ
ncbi:MAG: sugar phosphate nucleotidyltransferase [Deltaproteobacteria bacterium]|nr:sugar phosphate nucleotidyltransferase [Deltaproteobacteria bacterium]